MIRQILLAIAIAVISWNAAEELWERHGGGCSTDYECGCVNCLGD